MENRNEKSLTPVFYGNPFVARNALVTSNEYGQQGLEKILLLLHHYNLKSVGVNDSGTSDGSLMKEMVVKMMAE